MYIKARAANFISICNCSLWRITHPRYLTRRIDRGCAYAGAIVRFNGDAPFEAKRLSMTSNQSIAITTAFGLGLAFVPAAWADPASDACAALATARSALYSMINAKEKSEQDALNAKVQAASTKLDTVLAGMTGADTKVAADFEAVWDQFKATREKEIIPAIYKGNVAEAKKITDGIQYERLSKMWSIMSCR
jgi:hypothetical protein